MSNYSIVVENLSKKFRLGKRGFSDLFSQREGRSASEFWALQDISFNVDQNEVLGVIGRNGAGKSTLLKILTRITTPTSGRFGLRGRVSSLLEVGTGFHPELTGRENIFLSGSLLGMTRRHVEKSLDAIVDFSETEEFLGTPVKHYSSGMRVRLGFAVAAHLEPEILLIDEVLAVGDFAFQNKCLGKMDEFSKSGRTILFVSHNLASVEALCKSVIWLDQGKLIYQGDVSEGIQKYHAHYGQLSEQVLADRTDRQGDGVVRIEKLSVHSTEGTIQSGKPLTIEATMVSQSPAGENCQLAFIVSNQLGQIIATFFNHFTDDSIVTNTKRTKVQCNVPALPLTKGNYQISTWLTANGKVEDQVEHALRFTVENADFFNTGRLPRANKHGNTLIPHSFTTSPE